jgi:hypothetical protein
MVIAGCSSNGGEQPASSFSGPAATKQAPAPEAPPTDSTATEPDIVTTGSVVMTVDDPAEAADKFVAATTDAGGRVQSRTEQTGSGSPAVDLILRIPSDKVDAVLADIDEYGVVESKSINYDDVTSQRVDLDARIKALQTSVTRLLDLMDKATNTADLLAAETSLTQRQAELDSLRAQRATLGDQISYATINVSLSSESKLSEEGFVGAVKQGWRALVSGAVGLAHVIGFLLPWLPVFVVIAAAVWALSRRRRRRRAVVPPNTPPAAPAADTPSQTR